MGPLELAAPALTIARIAPIGKIGRPRAASSLVERGQAGEPVGEEHGLSRTYSDFRSSTPRWLCFSKILQGPAAYTGLGGSKRLGGRNPGGTNRREEAGHSADHQGGCDAADHDPGRDDSGPALHGRVHRRHPRSKQYSCATAEDG